MVMSDALRAAIGVECARFPDTRGGLLPALHLAVSQHGALSLELVSEIAELFDVPPIEVHELARFSPLLCSSREAGEAPPAEHRVTVCTGLPCSLRGARTLLRGLAAHLEIEPGQTTADGRVELDSVACLGVCSGAPAISLSGDERGQVDLEGAKRFVDGLV